jgi:predicted CXXCH cytochrome family protein
MRILVVLAALALVPTTVRALELVAPDRDCALADGRVLVIGKEAKPLAGQGTFEWEQGKTTLTSWLGRFSAVANLPAGPHVAKIVFGQESVELHLVVAPSVPGNLYTYHPKVVTEECQACHDPEAPPAPGQDVAKICYACHTRYTSRSSVHSPVAQGLCSTCHDPHGAKNAAFLRSKPEILCATCHNRPITKAHEKLKDDSLCTECHDPHGSNRPNHLKRR